MLSVVKINNCDTVYCWYQTNALNQTDVDITVGILVFMDTVRLACLEIETFVAHVHITLKLSKR